jgi:hypothetical protein
VGQNLSAWYMQTKPTEWWRESNYKHLFINSRIKTMPNVHHHCLLIADLFIPNSRSRIRMKDLWRLRSNTVLHSFMKIGCLVWLCLSKLCYYIRAYEGMILRSFVRKQLKHNINNKVFFLTNNDVPSNKLHGGQSFTWSYLSLAQSRKSPHCKEPHGS